MLAGLLIVLLLAFIMIPAEKYKSLLSYGVAAATGRELLIEGSLDVKLGRTLAIEASGVKFANTAWGSRPYMASVDTLAGEVALLPLLKGILDVSLSLDRPDVLLETNASGKGNWELGAAGAAEYEAAEKKAETESDASGNSKLPLRPVIRKIDIKNTHFAFINHNAGTRMTLSDGTLQVETVGKRLAIDFGGSFNDIPLAFAGGCDNARFLADNTVTAVQIDGNAGKVKLAVTGSVGPVVPTFDLDLDLAVKADSLKAFSPKAARDLPNFGPLSMAARLKGRKGKYSVEDMQAVLRDDALSMEVKGSLEDAAAVEGLNLKAKIDTTELTAVVKVLGLQVEYALPDLLHLTLALEGNQNRLAVRDFQAVIQGRGIRVDCTAEVNNVMDLEGISADLVYEIESLDLPADIVGADLPSPGPINGRVRVVSKAKNLGLIEVQADIKSEKIQASATGSLGDPIKLKDVDAEVTLGITSFAWLKDALAIKLPPMGSLQAAARITSAGDALSLRDIQADLTGDNITLQVNGSVEDVLKIQGVDVTTDLTVRSLDFISEYAGMKLPPMGSLQAAARITSAGDALSLRDIQADLSGDNITLQVNGSVEDVLKIQGVDATADLTVRSLDFISEYAGMKLPPMGSLQAAARITSAGDALSLRDIQADLSGDNITLQVNGSVEDVLKIQGVDVTTDLTVPSLEFLSEFADMDLSLLGSLKASAVVSTDDGRFEIKNFKADLSGQHIAADIAGSLKDVEKLTGIDANFKIALDSLASLDILAKRKLPASESVVLTGKFSGEGGLKEPVDIDVSLKSDGVDANVNGRITDLLTAAGVDLAFNVKAESLAKTGKLTGVQFQSSDPLSMTGQFLTDEKAYRLSGLHLRAGKLDAKGDVAYQLQPSAADRPRVNGRLQIGELDISDLMLANKDPAPESADKTGPPVQEPENKNEAVKEKVFPSQPLPFDLLRSVDANFKLALDKLIAPQWEMNDFSVKIDLENGLLRLSPVTAGLGNGSLSGAVMLDTGKSPTALDIDLRVQAATLRNFSGNINFLADLAGSGDSVAAIMAGLSGLVELDIRNLILKNNLITDFAAGFFNFLNPLGKEKEHTQVICAVVLFKIEDGIADARRKIVAQMEDVTWIGGGEINLKTEEISLGISPRSRKLLDIDMGELASIGYLGGTLAQPKIAIDPKDIAIKYGKYTAAIFTGGLSFLADQLWRKIEANQDVCDRILQMAEAED